MFKFSMVALLSATLLNQQQAFSQTTFPVNGVADQRNAVHAFTNANIVVKPGTVLKNAILLVREGKIISASGNAVIPAGAVVTSLQGKWIYPSFIDIYSDYGITQPQRGPREYNYLAPAQLTSAVKGALHWNQTVHPETSAGQQFTSDEAKARQLRELGFGLVNTHAKDGIVRGSSVVVSLNTESDNRALIKDKAAAHYSFSKGTSTQSYPSSLMGSIALLRQTYLDASWYKSKPASEGYNLSLEAFNNLQVLPQIFDIQERGSDLTTKWNALRADRIGDEFGIQYILKASGYEYQRMEEMKASKASFILPLNFPAAMDTEDPNDLRFVSLADMKHWELAPTQPAAFQKMAIPFAFTTADLRESKQFLTMVRKAMEYGLTEEQALAALTVTPAALLKMEESAGTLEPGKMANFLVTSGPIFDEKTIIFQNYVQGNRYAVKEDQFNSADGQYDLNVQGPDGNKSYRVMVRNGQLTLSGKDSLKGRWSSDGQLLKLSFPETAKSRQWLRLSGSVIENGFQGNGLDSAGRSVTFTAIYAGAVPPKPDSAAAKKLPSDLGVVLYPFNGFGKPQSQASRPEVILIRNATVWTSEADSVLTNTDVLMSNGKITGIGKSIAAPAAARIIDGTGKFLTAGIIDEHSHIAASSINEGGQSVTSEVRIGDNLNPDDVNIYRQLSGGVTSSHILHGSANTIGGQTQMIKLRWGANDNGLKFEGADPFIKFALGENVKRSPAIANNRFPDSRMGVEQVLNDAFTRARDYQAAMRKASDGKTLSSFRRDLELDALVEIMNRQRFITCHSYVQSEITSALRIGEKFGFVFNTFTHILEGYKVADKMKAHGAAASTFSDWWNYKMEVVDAIAYNAAIMHRVGLNVAINSDDAEMARRLNQEAAKTVKYGGLTEQQAWRMVTINPATMLHLQNRTGSIKTGKDADLVLWSHNPLSIYAQSLYTIVDGIVQFDRQDDLLRRQYIRTERNRLMNKMAGEKKLGRPTTPAVATMEIMHHCMDHYHRHGLLVMDEQ